MSKSEGSKKKYLRLRIKIWIGFTLIFTPVFVVSYVWFYLYTTQKVLNNNSSSLVDTVEGAVMGGDLEGFVNI